MRGVRKIVWLQSEMDLLSNNYAPGKKFDYSLIPGRTPSAIRNKLKRQGMTPDRRRAWEPEEDARLRREYVDQNIPTHVLAQSMNRGISSIYHRAKRMGLERRPAKEGDGEDLQAHNLPWTEAEDQYLREEYPDKNNTFTGMAYDLRRTPGAVKERARILGLRRRQKLNGQKKEKKYTRPPPLSNEKREEVRKKVEELYQVFGLRPLARKLNVSNGTVAGMARKLGLRLNKENGV